MVKSSVRVFIRLRPTDKFAHDCIQIQSDEQSVTAQLPKRKKKEEYVNNQQDKWAFKFDAILNNCSQDVIYDVVCKPIILNVLDGYNGTIMCYGQTGAGKTYTMSGGNEFQQRGIIPRAIAKIFNEISNRPEMSFEVKVSYLEIYNEQLHDLLTDSNSVGEKDLSIQEDTKGNVSVRELRVQPCSNESDALSYFFEGNSNRAIAQHKLNTNSSRSHCIFTIHVSCRSRVESEGHTINSKLNCVDLAGSERLSKSGSEGQLMKEAMFINKSLTFLEQVVLALSTQGREHVPYRQAKLTNLLKDSLGGNCKMAMVANIWAEELHMEETISTLKFGSRMMRVQNEATVNVSIPPEVQIRKLQKEVGELKAELNMQNQIHGRQNLNYGDDFDDDERFNLQREVRDYIDGNGEIEVRTLKQVKEYFRVFKSIVENAEAEALARFQQGGGVKPLSAQTHKSEPQKGAANQGLGELQGEGGFSMGVGVPAIADKSKAKQQAAPEPKEETVGAPKMAKEEVASKDTVISVHLPERNECFEIFKQSDGDDIANRLKNLNNTVRESKRKLKEASVVVNESKLRIDELRQYLDLKRREREQYGADSLDVVDEEEFKALRELKDIKQKYHAEYETLQQIRQAKEYDERCVEQVRSQLLTDFDMWYSRNYSHGSNYMPPINSPNSTIQSKTIDKQEEINDDPESAAFYRAKKVAATTSHKPPPKIRK